ncbi:MAG: T9SS type A sorting domain-containing protein [Candidatus Eisenbacteria sp.]|nr:T9SS type A sorting domain-containing protein [Candidatus Eisenbacteria bacterium]
MSDTMTLTHCRRTRSFLRLALPLCLAVLIGQGERVWAEAPERPAVRPISLWQGEPPPVSPVVTRGLLADGVSSLGRLDALRAQDLFSTKAAGQAEPETLRIISIRVEFEESTGMTRGRFNLTPPESLDAGLPEHMIDPPPHNRSYFMKHLESLDRYYCAQSYGQIVIEYDVFPHEENGAYVLDSISVYNREMTQWSWTVEGLTALYRDAIVLADTSDSGVFEDADDLSVYIVFHSGPDLQTDVAFDSPNDIPSFMIALGDSDRFWVRTGSADSLMVYDGMVIPETVSQDGLVGAINGVLAHEFGHILGALDLYNTCNWATGIGFWGLMGSGNQVAFDLGLGVPVEGIVPPSMCAWTKWWLGFLEPETIDSSGTYSLRAVELQDGTANLYRIPINGDEYFLLENRQQRLRHGVASAIAADPVTGVAMGPVDSLGYVECRRDSSAAQCFESYYNFQYDYGLPGSGLLIWHIDDEKILETLMAYSNAVNCDYWRRGVDLEEADALKDMGNPYSFYNQGSEFDPFFRGNNDTFDESSVPNSNSNFNAVSHIAITDIDSLSSEMSFTVRMGAGVPGWPVAFCYAGWSDSLGAITVCDTARSEANAPAAVDVDGDGVLEIALAVAAEVHVLRLEGPAEVDGWPAVTGDSLLATVAAADLDGDGRGEVLARSGSGLLYAWEGDGTPFFGDSDTLGVFWRSPGNPVCALAVSDVDADGETDVLAAVGESLMVWGWEPGSRNVDLKWVQTWGDTIRALAVREAAGGVPAAIAVLLESGQVSLVDGGGQEHGGWPVGLDGNAGVGTLAFADVDRAAGGESELVVVTREGWITVLTASGETLPGWPVVLQSGVHSAPALGDLDGDGFLDLALGLENGQIEVLSYTGTPLLAWRVDVGQAPSAVFVDLTNDSRPELISSFNNRHLTAWDVRGNPVEGWPLPAGADASLTPLVSDLEGDGTPEVVAFGSDGRLYAYEVGWIPDAGPIVWGGYLGNSARTSCYPAALMPADPVERSVALADGDLVIYPNPSRDGVVHIQYRLGFATRVKVTIMDLSGQEIWQVEDFSSEGPNEVHWPTDSVASGLYLCRVEAGEKSGSTIVFRKVAVVK